MADEFGSQCAVVAIDARRRDGRRSRRRAGACSPTAAATPPTLDAIEWAVEAERRGAGEILLTSMDRDGTRDGFDLELTRAVSDAVGVPVIASGGVGTLQHLADGVTEGGADAVLAASIFHFGEHTVAEAKAVMAAAGITVRPAVTVGIRRLGGWTDDARPSTVAARDRRRARRAAPTRRRPTRRRQDVRLVPGRQAARSRC